MPPETFPEYRVKARNTSLTSENAIHHDDVARRYGFPGALVPGVTLYAYLTRPILDALSPAWLARGTASVRFVKPVLDGEELTVTGVITERDASGVTADASREHLAGLTALGTPEALYDTACAAGYLENVSESLGLYQGADGWVHPAFFLQQANRALRDNVRLGPWIHVSSVVRHLGGARVGAALATRGRVRSLFEKKGRELVELDLLIVAGASARPVAHVRHTAIYHLPAPDA